MKAQDPEQKLRPFPDMLELCPRCKLGLVFRPAPTLPTCYVCGGLEPGDRGPRYERILLETDEETVVP